MLFHRFAFHFNLRPYGEAETEFDTFGSKPNTCCIAAANVLVNGAGTALIRTSITKLLCDIEAVENTECNPTPGEGFNLKVEGLGFEDSVEAQVVRDRVACMCCSGIVEIFGGEFYELYSNSGVFGTFLVRCMNDDFFIGELGGYIFTYGYCGGEEKYV